MWGEVLAKPHFISYCRTSQCLPGCLLQSSQTSGNLPFLTCLSSFYNLPWFSSSAVPLYVIFFKNLTLLYSPSSYLSIFLFTHRKSVFRVGDASPYKHPPKAQLPQSTLTVTFYRC